MKRSGIDGGGREVVLMMTHIPYRFTIDRTQYPNNVGGDEARHVECSPAVAHPDFVSQGII